MNRKVLPIVGNGYTSQFFRLDFSDQDWSEKPHLRVSAHTSAQFALCAADNGLSGIGIEQGDLLLFSTTLPLLQQEQISLIRAEDEYIVGEACWTPDMTTLRAKHAEAAPLDLPTENIRIVAALDNVIKHRDDLDLIYFRKVMI